MILRNRLSSKLAAFKSFEAESYARAVTGSASISRRVNRGQGYYVGGSLAVAKSGIQWVRCVHRVLRTVSELHRMGYQRLRVMPYDAPVGYRVWIAPAQAFSRINGAYCEDMDLESACYSAQSEGTYFGWQDAAQDNARQLADKFVERFPRVCELGRGSDWAYAGWLADLLAKLEHHADKVPHIDLTDFVDVLPDRLAAIPLRRVAGAGPEITPGDVLFPLPPIPA